MVESLGRSTKKTTRWIEGGIEAAVFAVAYYFVWRHLYDGKLFPTYYGKGKYVLMGLYWILSVFIFENTDGFAFADFRRLEVALAQWIGLCVVNAITYLQLCLIANVMISIVPIAVLTALQAVIVVPFVYLYTWINHRIYSPHNILMVVGNYDAVKLKFKMDDRRDKYVVRKLMSIGAGVEQICREVVNYDSVVINDVPAKERNDILKFCYQQGIRVYLVPKLSDILVRRADAVTFFDTPLVVVDAGALSQADRFMKRALDIVLCSIALIAASPVMLIVALAIKLEDGGPVFYRQERVTIGGKRFNILKFRSMIVDAEKGGKSIPATGSDSRITKVGRFIRPKRIDELPQILNILKGDMSIVGPRPERTEHVEKYSALIPEFSYRLKVKGGLTGYAQIYGKYNTSPYDKLRLDLTYIENYSILLDIKLILMTLRILLKKESTEGFEKTAELEERKQQLINSMSEK